MKIWNLFEQSGHFKDVEKEMGYDGIDVDCVKTDHTDYVMDLLAEMDKWEKGKKSIFDEIKQDDFVFSFFPCIRFENRANMMIQGHNYPTIYKPMVDRLDISRERERERSMWYGYFCLFCEIMLVKGVRCVIENPYAIDHYLVRYCPLKSDYVIMDRSKYGDYFKKPTQFWFLNCEPRDGLVAVDWENKPTKIVDKERGINRSLISKEFIRVFLSEIVDLEGEAIKKKYD